MPEQQQIRDTDRWSPAVTGHMIQLTLDADGVHAKFVCHEDADNPCHQTCSFGCEIWDEECLENHPRESIDYCNPIEFLDNGGLWYELYTGEETEPRSGPIVFEWIPSDWYGWRYAESITE